ncbi:MAG: hypothetical protein R2705_20280 [Ilumatobacteraceae bacterium]
MKRLRAPSRATGSAWGLALAWLVLITTMAIIGPSLPFSRKQQLGQIRQGPAGPISSGPTTAAST